MSAMFWVTTVDKSITNPETSLMSAMFWVTTVDKSDIFSENILALTERSLLTIILLLNAVKLFKCAESTRKSSFIETSLTKVIFEPDVYSCITLKEASVPMFPPTILITPNIDWWLLH